MFKQLFLLVIAASMASAINVNLLAARATTTTSTTTSAGTSTTSTGTSSTGTTTVGGSSSSSVSSSVSTSTTSIPPPAAGVAIHPNGNNAKCMDVRGGTVANGTPVQIYDCNGTNAQKWTIQKGQTKVRLAGTNFCLDAGGSPGNGVAHAPPHDHDHQDMSHTAVRSRTS